MPIRQDARYALRTWRRTPGIFTAALLALALAMSAVTTIVTIVAAVLLRPLPYEDPGRLVMVWQDTRARGGREREWASPGLFVEWQRRATSFSHLAAVRGWQPNLTGAGEPERLRGAAVSGDYFPALGVRPLAGRPLGPDDDRPGAPAAVVIAHSLWTRRFAADASIVGQRMLLDGQPATIVGVMPAGFRPAIVDAEIWSALRINPAAAPRGMIVLRVLGRVREGVTIDQAHAQMAALASQLAGEDPEWDRTTVSLVALHAEVVGSARTPLLVLTGGVTLVLLLACANVANLLLARAADRTREVTVRVALGASRRAIVQHRIADAVLLAGAAGGIALLLCWWAIRAIVALAPPDLPRVQEVAVDWSLLVFIAAVTLAVAIVSGLPPVVATLRADLVPGLRDGGRESTRPSRWRSILVCVEVAVATVLIVGAVLLVRTFLHLQRVDLGFRPEGLLTAAIQPPRGAYRDPDALRNLHLQVLERAGAVEGAQSAAITSMLPLSGGEIILNFGIRGRPPARSPADEPIASFRVVSESYFDTLGMRMVAGRSFTHDDRREAPAVIVVNETLARQYWPGQPAVGRQLDVEGRDAVIVGVVADARHLGPADAARGEMYAPLRQFDARGAWIVVRTAGDPGRAVPALRLAVRQIDPNLPLASIATMTQRLERLLAQPRFVAALLSGFAVLAGILALVGVYSVLSFTVSRRTREIGVRMALGASRRRVLTMVLLEGGLRIGGGLAIGCAAAAACAALLRTMIVGVHPQDPATLAAVAAVMGATATAASYLPARRAARVDPVEALRQD